MENERTLAIVPGRADKEVAEELKMKLAEKISELCAIIDEGRRAGFEVAFNLGRDFAGKSCIGQLVVSKNY